MVSPSAALARLAEPLYPHRRAAKSTILIVILWAAAAFGQTFQPRVRASFGYRENRAHPIPARWLGINLAALNDSNSLTELTQAGFSESRKIAGIPEVYETTTPNWNSIDRNMTMQQSNGLHPVILLAYSPPWLQPTQGPCAGVPTVPPTDIAQWAQIAASYVAHLDQAFPGLVHDYEIWNEPELQKSFCVADDRDATRLKLYLSIYAAAASAMRTQAEIDGVKIRIGGPTIAVLSRASEWISTLLSNSRTAPNVDFVSYHMYLTGDKEIRQGMDWSTLYSITQSSSHGQLFNHLNVENLVRQGHQPDPSSTPIYVTEYNDNWTFEHDCCRNDPSFAALWNSVFMANFLNSVYEGAKHVPDKLFYFAGNAGPYMCIAGTWNTNMDCDPGDLQPYPQFYAYQLLASPDYLGLAGGGYMASWVRPGSTQTGLMATAFYTHTKDVIVIVNPTYKTHPAVRVVANHSGIKTGVGTLFLLDQNHAKITSTPLPLETFKGGYAATISVPAYSTVAVTIEP